MRSLVKAATHLHQLKSIESNPLAAKVRDQSRKIMVNLSLYRTEVKLNSSLWLQEQEATSEATVLWT